MTEQNGKSKYTIRQVAWDSPDAEKLKAIRMRVFVEEQNVPTELEMDNIDPTAFHVLAENADGTPCGTGRMYTDPDDELRAKIGRMAVLKEYRGTGCGTAILTALVTEARLRDFAEAALSSQTHAAPFYRTHGFAPVGETYDDAGIPHQYMTMRLA